MKTLIITGGNINIEIAKEYLKKYSFDLIIAADKGLEILNRLGIEPNYIIGDFDSIDEAILKKYKENKLKIITLNPEKDYTDTHAAVKLAIENNAEEVVIMGGIGSRIDHTIANIHILKELLDKNIQSSIINENNIIKLINKNVEIKKNEEFQYISLIPLTTEIKGLTLRGFKYELTNATLKIGDSLGVSNEQIKELAKIDIKKGILIIIQSKD